MSLAELIPVVDQLPKQEKVDLFQHLKESLAGEGLGLELLTGQSIEVWSPFDAHDTAAALEHMLAEHKAKS